MIGSTSIALLVVANLLPVFGVLLLDWDVFALIFLFWCENVVIGLFGIARTIKAAGIFLGAFFFVHYGGFMAGHLMLIHALFAAKSPETGAALEPLQYFIGLFDTWTLIGVLGLFVSHAWSYFENYLGNREYESLTGGSAMALAYRRMVITHIALLAAGFFLMKLHQPIVGLLLLLGMKLAMDISFHRREHDQLA